MKASWNGAVIAESDATIEIEGNQYFPPESVNRKFLRESAHTSFCGWKGEASYFDIVVDEKVNANAAWYYSEPMEAAKQIKNYIAFWKGVEISDT